jgi:hypothetical protein
MAKIKAVKTSRPFLNPLESKCVLVSLCSGHMFGEVAEREREISLAERKSY